MSTALNSQTSLKIEQPQLPFEEEYLRERKFWGYSNQIPSVRDQFNDESKLSGLEDKIVIVSGTGDQRLTDRISWHLNLPKSSLRWETFKDSERRPYFDESVRGKSIYIVYEGKNRQAEGILEMNLLCDAATRAEAAEICFLFPYLPYSRQDKLDNNARTSLGAKVILDSLSHTSSAGTKKRFFFMDLHNDSIRGFTDCNSNLLFSSTVQVPTIANYFKENKLTEITLVGVDSSSLKRSRKIGGFLTELGITVKGPVHVDKDRIKDNEVASTDIHANTISGPVLMIDDMIDTGGSVRPTASGLKRIGASHVFFMASHGILSANAYQILTSEDFDQVFLTDSLPYLLPYNAKINLTSCAPVFAAAIIRDFIGESIRGLAFSDVPPDPIVWF